MRNCKNCIWNDQCGTSETCDYYEEYAQTSLDELEYEKNLRMRFDDYQAVVAEYND